MQKNLTVLTVEHAGVDVRSTRRRERRSVIGTSRCHELSLHRNGFIGYRSMNILACLRHTDDDIDCRAIRERHEEKRAGIGHL